MTYTEYLQLPAKEQFKYRFKDSLGRFGQGFINFFIGIGFFFVNLVRKIGRSFKETKYAFNHGDIWTKLSFIFLGISQIRRGQVFKGICYLVIELVFIFYIVAIGGYAIYQLQTLGVVSIHYYCSIDESSIAAGFENIVFTDQNAAIAYCTTYGGSEAIYTYTEYGDNSFTIMLFGVLAVIISVVFVAFYHSVIKKSIEVQERKEAHLYINRAFDDFKELLDKKFYVTLLILPIIGLCVFTILPLIDMILMAFTNYNSTHQYPTSMFSWVGFSNFINLFSGSDSGDYRFSYTFFNILLWTLVWAVLATFLNYFLGMILAMVINKKGIKFKKVWRTCFVLSIAMPQFVSLLTWNQFLSVSGMVELVFKQFGWMASTEHITILDQAYSARIAVILINIWIGVPYTILTTTGILMNIPADLYESAQIDGASPITRYFKITLPYILFVTGPYLITQFVGNINNFNVIYFLTGGAPYNDANYLYAGQTDLLVTWLYKLTVNEQNYSYASVIGIMIFTICAVFSLIAYKNSSAMKDEENFA